METNLIGNDMLFSSQFFKRAGGVLLLAIAFIWLDQFKGTMFMIAKMEFVLAAILFAKIPRVSTGRSFRLEKEWRSGKDWIMVIIAAILMSTALTVFGRFEPYSIELSIKFVLGAMALMYSIELILGKTPKRKIVD